MKLFDVWLVYHKLLLANSCGMQDMASANSKLILLGGRGSGLACLWHNYGIADFFRGVQGGQFVPLKMVLFPPPPQGRP